MKKLSLFDFIGNINQGLRGPVFPPEDVESGYVPFMVNRGFSYFNETVLLANEMNTRAGSTTKSMQYNFLKSTIRPAKRFSKWLKRADDSVDVETIKTAYGYSTTQAQNVLKLLSPEQLKVIRDIYLQTGGKV